MGATSHTYQSIVFDEKAATRRIGPIWLQDQAKGLDRFGSPALKSQLDTKTRYSVVTACHCQIQQLLASRRPAQCPACNPGTAASPRPFSQQAALCRLLQQLLLLLDQSRGWRGGPLGQLLKQYVSFQV